ncbi:thiocillin family RiPP [Brevibacillus laterosporus]|uniref:thiocillin family RiPP n=1 Tax=Brevibacillus laterosporus TaxID=1465 RepID=UPI003D22EEC7
MEKVHKMEKLLEFDLYAEELTEQLDAAVVYDCAGTAGSVGTLWGTLGTLGTYGSY